MAIRFCKGDVKKLDMKESIIISNNLFKEVHNKIINNNELVYIPVVDINNKYIFTCYDDKNLDQYLDKLIIMSNSEYGKNQLKKSLDNCTIVSFNEFGYYLYNILISIGCNINVKGELWDYFINNKSNSISNKKIYLEGNIGLSLDECGIFKNTLPHDEYEFISNIYNKCKKNNKLYNKRFINKKDINKILTEKIKSNKPFMAARLGNTESIIINESIYSYYQKLWLEFLYTTSGFYSKTKYNSNFNKLVNLKDIEMYSNMSLNAINNTDIHLCRFDSEVSLINNYSNKDSLLTDWYNLYTDFDKNNCWLSALKNKKVLIISSFNKSIKKQYDIKDIINKGILPDIDLIYYDSPQTYLGNYNEKISWFEVLNNMINDIQKIDFDVALIACGSYGYILSSKIKNMGKQAIELCSGLYPIFGIKNKTQIIIRKVSKMYDKNWIFPIEEKPNNYMNLEKGAYWE